MFEPIFLCNKFVTTLEFDNVQLAKDVLELKDDKAFKDPKHTFFEDSDYPTTKLGKKLISAVDQVIKENIHSGFSTQQKWSHIINPGESTGPHQHSDRQNPMALSWVYYVDADDSTGDLIFSMMAEKRRVIDYVIPETGKLVIFPDWITHYTQRNTSDKIRISVSGNAYVSDYDLLEDGQNFWTVYGIGDD